MRIRIFVLLSLLLVWQGAFGQNPPPADKPPRLVVMVIAGSLSPEVMAQSWRNLSPEGMYRMRNGGVEYLDARYPHLLCNAVSGVATIATGTTPEVHGVMDEVWYGHLGNEAERLTAQTMREGSTRYLDPSQGPQKLLVGTISHAWRAAFPEARIYSAAFTPEVAIALGGRSASAAFWLNGKSGDFVTSTFYGESVPAWLAKFNTKGLAREYNAQPWIASRAPSMYATLPFLLRVDDPQFSPYARKLAANEPNITMPETKIYGPQFTRLGLIPQGNTLLKDLAVAAVLGDSLGMRKKTPDLLTLYYSPLENIATLYGPNSLQAEDALLRFDRELGQLLEFLDHTVGRGHYLMVLTSAYPVAPTPHYLNAWQLPAGQFSFDRAVFLLNSYFRALYGVADLVLGHAAGQIYFDQKRIEDTHLSTTFLNEQAVKFLLNMAGVARVYTASSLQLGSSGSEEARRAAANFHPKRGGDLLVTLLPGWIATSRHFPTAKGADDSYANRVPLLLYGWKLRPKQVITPVSPTDIAPTICHLMGIAPPLSSNGKLLPGSADWEL